VNGVNGESMEHVVKHVEVENKEGTEPVRLNLMVDMEERLTDVLEVAIVDAGVTSNTVQV